QPVRPAGALDATRRQSSDPCGSRLDPPAVRRPRVAKLQHRRLASRLLDALAGLAVLGSAGNARQNQAGRRRIGRFELAWQVLASLLVRRRKLTPAFIFRLALR